MSILNVHPDLLKFQARKTVLDTCAAGDRAHHAQPGDPQAVLDLREFLENEVGSCLGAWLAHFDRDNDQGVSSAEFFYALQLMGYPVDSAKEVFNVLDENKSGELCLDELDPEDAKVWWLFRSWCVDTFRSVDNMLWSLGGKAALHFNQVDNSQFCEGIKKLGWCYGSEQLLFAALDIDNKNRVRAEDLKWFIVELDRFRRKEAAKKQVAERLRMRGKCKASSEHQQGLVDNFKNFLKRHYGGYFRAWRCLSDPGVFTLKKRQFFKACAEVGWTKDISCLWKALGKTDDSCIIVDEIDLQTSKVLAHFNKSIKDRFGTAMAAFRTMDKRHPEKVSLSEFAELFGDDALLLENSQFIYHELKRYGKKYMTAHDFLFCDRWTPLIFFEAKPSPAAAALFKEKLLLVCKNYVKAWRKVMDVDSSNHCTWDEFVDACKSIGFDGDCAGAWREFDSDFSGSISLREIDPVSSDILVDFRIWADEEFGSVRSAFTVFDGDRSGQMSMQEWRHACRIYGYDGCARLLFRALDTDEGGSLSKMEIAFLDGWELDGYEKDEQPAVDDDVVVPSDMKVPRVLAMTASANDKAELGKVPKRRGSMQKQFREISNLPVPVLREIEHAALKAMELFGNHMILPPPGKKPKANDGVVAHIPTPPGPDVKKGREGLPSLARVARRLVMPMLPKRAVPELQWQGEEDTPPAPPPPVMCENVAHGLRMAFAKAVEPHQLKVGVLT